MQTIKSRLIVLLLLSLVCFVLLMGFTVNEYKIHAQNSQNIIAKTQVIVTGVLETQVHFKRQVQEWKNILLRGHKRADYEKYLNQFHKENNSVNKQVDTVLNFLEKDTNLYHLINQFKQLHAELESQYAKGLAIYNNTEKQPYFAADKQVRGIDRQPSELLDDIVHEVYQYKDIQLNESNAEFDKAEKFILILSSIVIVVAYLFFYFSLARFIFSPIQKFTVHVKNLSEGQSDLSQRLYFDKKTELGVIASHFNYFLEKLNTTFQKINLTSDKLMQASTKSAHITESTNQSIRKQNSDIVALNESMNTMASSIDDVVVLSNNAKNVANEVKIAANNGHNEVIEVDNMITALSGNVDKTAVTLTDLNQEINSINDISDLITSIAEQTSLLSLNAAIEAARAGESGRGFAVVADEVRDLARKTNEATDKIKETVQKIMGKSSESISMINEGTEIAQNCKDQGDRVITALTEITNSISNILDANDKINLASSVQENLTIDVRKSIKDIEADLSVTAEDAQKNTSDSSDLAQLSLMLQTLIREFRIDDQVKKRDDADVELF